MNCSQVSSRFTIAALSTDRDTSRASARSAAFAGAVP
jgi:hypothetical protein